MRKKFRRKTYRRWPKRASGRTSVQPRSQFVGTVALVAIIAFFGTLMWPRSADFLSEEGRGGLASAQDSGWVYDFACDVAYVNDGDTLRCRDGTRVRLHAIAARETDGTCTPGHPCPTASASMSTAALTQLAGRRITCIQTGTSYERVTAICRNASGVEINCAMVQRGAALVWDRFNRQQPICRS